VATPTCGYPGPIFSTDTMEAELMLIELRLSLHRPASQFGAPGRGKSAHRDGVGLSPNLSTAFTDGMGPRSTADDTSIQSLGSARKEKAG
jgi:hypothetical protein